MLRAWNRLSLIRWICLKFTILCINMQIKQVKRYKKKYTCKFNFAVTCTRYTFLIFFVDWSNTSLGASPMALNQSSMTLPYVLHEFTPNWVAILGMQYAKTCNSFFNIAYMDLEFISIEAQNEKYFGIHVFKNLYQ